MSEPRTVRCYAYVNRPYEAVRALMRVRALEAFKRATTSAAARASAIAASLHATLAGVDFGVDAHIEVRRVTDDEGVAGLPPVTHVKIAWEAAHAPGLFPIMNADLSFWPLTSDETQLEIEGAYRPPLGAVGNAIDTAAGHRIAEATVHRFLDDIVEQLRVDIPTSG